MKLKFFVLSVVSACGLCLSAESTDFPEHPTFQQIRNSALSPEMAQSIKSARIIFSVTGDKGVKGFFMLRAKRFDQVRLDILKGKEHLCAVRDKDQFWLYNAKEGAVVMSPAEAAGFEQYIAFLSVPFYQKEVFSDPVFVKEETVNNAKRSVFEVKALNASGELCQMSVENETKLLRKTRKTNKNDKVGYIVIYRDYKTIHGVKVAGRMSVSRVNTNLKLKLVAADWNLTIDDSIFRKGKDIRDQEVTALLNRQVITENEKKEEELKKEIKVTIATLERRIRKQKAEIEEDEARLKIMEEVLKSDRKDIVEVTESGTPGGSRSYWNGSCWSTRIGNYDHTRSRAARKFGKEYESVKKEYQQLRNSLLKKKADLQENEVRLKKLKGE